jgi:hypothetical protein
MEMNSGTLLKAWAIIIKHKESAMIKMKTAMRLKFNEKRIREIKTLDKRTLKNRNLEKRWHKMQ